MNKTIVSSVIAGVALLSPVAAMGISPVREALLGLAPEEQIVTLADKIDQTRSESKAELEERKKEVEALKEELSKAKSTISEYDKKLSEQGETIEKQDSKIVAASSEAKEAKSDAKATQEALEKKLKQDAEDKKEAEEKEKKKQEEEQKKQDAKEKEAKKQAECDSYVENNCKAPWLKIEDYDKTHNLDSESLSKYKKCQEAMECD